MSLDGFISDENGGFDWIKGDGNKDTNVGKEFIFPDFIKNVDTIVMGKYAFLDCGIEFIDDFKSKTFYVTTSQKLETKYDNVHFISGDIWKQILDLKKEEGKNIWLFGGGVSIDPFIKANIIDEYIIGIIPIILGKGRPLFLGNNPTIELALDEVSSNEGVTMLTYKKRI